MATNKKGSTAPPDPEKVAEALSNNMLREMINELEETKLKLLLNIKELKDKLTQQKDDQADIYFYLNKKCDEGFEVIASLEEQIINEQTDREIAEKIYENKIDELKAAHQAMDAKHLSKISELETRLEMLNSFNEEKEESERNLKVLMNKLEEERGQFRVNTESIENRFLLERDKLRKTYDQKYEKIKKELEDSVESKMSNKTKKTQLMNVIMKKELDSQSQHAEKLLQINENMLNRDKALKLELDVSTSLNKDMTMRLAMAQRTIKALNDKVGAMEAAETTAKQAHDAALHEKVEAVIQLEAKMKNVSKKTTAENGKMDEMWHFLAQSFQMLKAAAAAKKKKHGSLGSHGSTGKDGIEDHEQLLVGLVKEVLRRYPQLLHDGGYVASATHAGGPAGTGTGRREGGASPPPPSSFSSSVSVSTSWVQSQTTLSATTGIPAWDAAKTVEGKGKDGNPSHRSVAVQTEGKVAPYPDGSLWMEAPGARSLHFQQQSAALSAAAAAAAAADGDNSSIGFNSVQSLWRSIDRGGGGGGDSLSVVSQDDNYSAKTASHVLQAPQRSKTKPSKIISKMRRQNMRNAQTSGGGGNSASGGSLEEMLQRSQPSYMTIEGGEARHHHAGGTGNARPNPYPYYGTSGTISSSSSGNHFHHLARQPRSPLSVDLTLPQPLVPSPLSLGSSAHLLATSHGYGGGVGGSGSGGGYGHGSNPLVVGGGMGVGVGVGMRPSPWLANALLGGAAGSLAGGSSSGGAKQPTVPFSPTMSISGQGFVAPLVLPRLN